MVRLYVFLLLVLTRSDVGFPYFLTAHGEETPTLEMLTTPIEDSNNNTNNNNSTPTGDTKCRDVLNVTAVFREKCSGYIVLYMALFICVVIGAFIAAIVVGIIAYKKYFVTSASPLAAAPRSAAIVTAEEKDSAHGENAPHSDEAPSHGEDVLHFHGLLMEAKSVV